MTAAPTFESTLRDQRSAGDRGAQRAAGKSQRSALPREALADLHLPADRDPVALLRSQDDARVEHLVPIRWERMLASPFTFYRGTALLMADDLAVGPASPLLAQCCGDAHLGNFGIYNSPERKQVFDINDFDETAIAPVEWDIKRLAASMTLAARDCGADAATTDAITRATVAQYRERIHEFAELSALELWYRHLDVSRIIDLTNDAGRTVAAKNVAKLAAKAEKRTNLRSFEKLTTVVDGHRQFVEDPPFLERIGDEFSDQIINTVLTQYEATLPPERRVLFDRYSYVDGAVKVVGVGSVGTRCYIGLFEGESTDDWLILQVKEAVASALTRAGTTVAFANQGERVVTGQRMMQAASDIFLGWTSNPELGHDFYVRQLHDGKGAVDLTTATPEGLAIYGPLCAAILARGHARSGSAARIAGYLGTGEKFDDAITRWCIAYADQTERDYDAALAARKAGAIPGPA